MFLPATALALTPCSTACRIRFIEILHFGDKIRGRIINKWILLPCSTKWLTCTCLRRRIHPVSTLRQRTDAERGQRRGHRRVGTPEQGEQSTSCPNSANERECRGRGGERRETGETERNREREWENSHLREREKKSLKERKDVRVSELWFKIWVEISCFIFVSHSLPFVFISSAIKKKQTNGDLTALKASSALCVYTENTALQRLW